MHYRSYITICIISVICLMMPCMVLATSTTTTTPTTTSPQPTTPKTQSHATGSGHNTWNPEASPPPQGRRKSIKDIYAEDAAKKKASVYPSQQSLILSSCEKNDSKYWRDKRSHQELCASLQFRAYMPSKLAPGWTRDDIMWHVKTKPSDIGFSEGNQLRGVYEAYSIYPIFKYTYPSTNAKIVVFITHVPYKVKKLKAELTSFFKEGKRTPPKIGTDAVYHIDTEDKPSIYNRKTTYRMANVAVGDVAYVVLYTENIRDAGVIEQFIKQINYGAVTAQAKLLAAASVTLPTTAPKKP